MIRSRERERERKRRKKERKKEKERKKKKKERKKERLQCFVPKEFVHNCTSLVIFAQAPVPIFSTTSCGFRLMGSGSTLGLPALALFAPPPMPEVEGPKRTFNGKWADLRGEQPVVEWHRGCKSWQKWCKMNLDASSPPEKKKWELMKTLISAVRLAALSPRHPWLASWKQVSPKLRNGCGDYASVRRQLTNKNQ